jgi:gamma-glutamyltranspeptidase/glutathione hydrolase
MEDCRIDRFVGEAGVTHRRAWCALLVLTAFTAALIGGLLLAGAARAASPEPIMATDGLVVSENSEASLIGTEILRRGGNAIDAAIATHFALAVAYPQAGNLGGGGFMLIRTADGACEAIDFREVAPAAATREMFLDARGRPDPRLANWSRLAAGVPGSVAGMALAHERHGTLAWRDLLAPARRLASDGFALDRYTAVHFTRCRGRLAADPESRRIFLRGDSLWNEGDTFRQPELAETLKRIARLGPREFYEGETAGLLVAEMEEGEGIITREDLRAYRAKIREPVSATYRDLTVFSMPPPSSGGVALLQMLRLLEPFPVGALGAHSSRSSHLLAEVMKRAFADRAEFLGDPDFTPLPVAGLLERTYIDSLREGIDPLRATPHRQAGPGMPRGAGAFYEATGTEASRGAGRNGGGVETTHFSIVDAEGNAVAVTTTLNTSYGSGIAVSGAGFLLNNEMDDFAAAPGQPNYYGLIQGDANAVRPFARPLSSMTPVIAMRGDALSLLLGSPGGPRIITSVLQTLLNVVDHGMDIQEAIDAPRIHHQWRPDTLYVEPRGLAEDVRVALEKKGHRLGVKSGMGSVQGIQILTVAGGQRILLGASDPRRNGCPVGLRGDRIVSRCAPRECR